MHSSRRLALRCLVLALALASAPRGASASALPSSDAREPDTASAPAAGIRWEKSFRDALKRARAEGRPLLVDFWADWCHWCHELDRTTYRDPAVVAASSAFVAVKVDTEGSLGDKQVSAEYGVETLPTIAFLSPGGHVLLVRQNFEGPEAFASTLEAARRSAGEVIGWESALSRDGNDAVALARLGAHLVQQNRLAEGRELLERAAKCDAAQPSGVRKHTRVLLGTLQAKGGRYREAEKLFQSALELQPPEASEDAAAVRAKQELAQRSH